MILGHTVEAYVAEWRQTRYVLGATTFDSTSSGSTALHSTF